MICDNCKWYRWKSIDNDVVRGICDNPKVIEQVTLISEGFLEMMEITGWKKDNVVRSLRFNGNFGCIHFEPKEETT